jgi:hypothetical protein
MEEGSSLQGEGFGDNISSTLWSCRKAQARLYRATPRRPAPPAHLYNMTPMKGPSLVGRQSMLIPDLFL